MEYYTDLDLHLQFIGSFCNEHIYTDRSYDLKYILPTSKLTGNLLLNAVAGVNCIQFVLPRCKLQQFKVTNKTITGTKQYVN